MISIDPQVTPASLEPAVTQMWEASAGKLLAVERRFPPGSGTPVFTRHGQYTARGWTEWTEGFVYGSALLQFDATGDERFLALGRQGTVERMASHVSHVGVHDHGFNNVSTYGNLWRLMREGRMAENDFERRFYELALKVSGAVQAARWTDLGDGRGYIYSFNGPHSLFADTIRSCRSLALGHLLGHVLKGEQDRPISLLERLIRHAETTARYNVWYGQGRDYYDVRGRVAHESIFNLHDRSYRCPSSQQGFSPFTTWTRGLAWLALGYPEELEFLECCGDSDLEPCGGRGAVEAMMRRTACAVCDFYIDHTPTDGVPYWDTGAPNLHLLGKDYLHRPADPYNRHEPVDSSAAAIAAQGLLRLGRYLTRRGETQDGTRYTQAGLTVTRRLLEEPYLSTDADHQGLLRHSVYHRPNGWDLIPPGQAIPCGEASMWGDYHLRELALYVGRLARGQGVYHFFGPTDAPSGRKEP
ncbi:MAG: glycosyl hydrolase [Phycisphaeraceae bacterium]|nr:glycosyl hydrolase [Phycisphaeraceae bacterium]